MIQQQRRSTHGSNAAVKTLDVVVVVVAVARSDPEPCSTLSGRQSVDRFVSTRQAARCRQNEYLTQSSRAQSQQTSRGYKPVGCGCTLVVARWHAVVDKSYRQTRKHDNVQCNNVITGSDHADDVTSPPADHPSRPHLCLHQVVQSRGNIFPEISLQSYDVPQIIFFGTGYLITKYDTELGVTRLRFTGCKML